MCPVLFRWHLIWSGGVVSPISAPGRDGSECRDGSTAGVPWAARRRLQCREQVGGLGDKVHYKDLGVGCAELEPQEVWSRD